MKLTETEVGAPETKQQVRKKRKLPFVTQYQPLVSTVKEALMEKWNRKKKTNRYFANFLKNHPLFPKRKENHGKEHAC